MESSILESIGVEIIGVMSPVSICMFLVVLLVYSLSSSTPDSTPIQTAANLVYLETPTDSTTQKLEGALLNAAVFIVLITVVTFLLVLLYYYNFTNFLKNYMRFSAFFVLGSMGGSIFLSIIQHFSIPIDSITCVVLLFNFTILGVLSVFSRGIPIFIRQVYMVLLGIIVATWFTKLPEWTTWVLLVALALYDLVAVLAPGGPLKILVELASSRDEELPALVYEARPVVSRNSEDRGGSLGLLVVGASGSSSVELQPVTQNRQSHQSESSPARSPSAGIGNLQANEMEEAESSPLVAGSRSSGGTEYSWVNMERLQASHLGNENTEIVEEEASPLVELMGMGHETEPRRDNSRGDGESEGGSEFSLTTTAGLGCTLILLSVCHQALPALPISITLGIMFYFFTRLLMEPFVVGTSTNLMMF